MRIMRAAALRLTYAGLLAARIIWYEQAMNVIPDNAMPAGLQYGCLVKAVKFDTSLQMKYNFCVSSTSRTPA